MKKSLILLFLVINIVCYAQVAVIANKSVPLETITETKLLDIYSGDIKWWENGDLKKLRLNLLSTIILENRLHE